ncbi:hypothetical protein BC628DRAFT_1333204 [Trametes gibbosa]|nr:hypothetical protein BC628DRAFT_1333204 [Trametes gibbosa]
MGGSVTPLTATEGTLVSPPSSPTTSQSISDSDTTPSATQAAPLAEQAPPPTPTDTPQPTAIPVQTTIETSTSVIPVTSIINLSGTAATTTVWMSPLPSASDISQSQPSGVSQGRVSTGEMIAIAVACVSLLSLLILGFCFWKRRKRARNADGENPSSSDGDYQPSPVEDPFKYHSLQSTISIGMSKRTASPLPIHAMHTMHRSTEAAQPEEYHPDDPLHGSSRPSSTLSYINSLCPETTTAHFPEPPDPTHAHQGVSRPQTPQASPTPKSYTGAIPRPAAFRPLPMPAPLSPFAAAHFAQPEERASVWSVMEVEDARGTLYETLVWNGEDVLEIGSPPEYSREG